jgi:hypothetical protein
METIASLAKSAAHAGRWFVNAALMAVGVAPPETPLVRTALLPLQDGYGPLLCNERAAPSGEKRYQTFEEGEALWPSAMHANPSTGLPLVGGSMVDAGGYGIGETRW